MKIPALVGHTFQREETNHYIYIYMTTACQAPLSMGFSRQVYWILEWVVISFSRGSSLPRDQTQVSCIAGRFFTHWAMRETHIYETNHYIYIYIQIYNIA